MKRRVSPKVMASVKKAQAARKLIEKQRGRCNSLAQHNGKYYKLLSFKAGDYLRLSCGCIGKKVKCTNKKAGGIISILDNSQCTDILGPQDVVARAYVSPDGDGGHWRSGVVGGKRHTIYSQVIDRGSLRATLISKEEAMAQWRARVERDEAEDDCTCDEGYRYADSTGLVACRDCNWYN